MTQQTTSKERCQCDECKTVQHKSDCAVHNEPAYPNSKCDCGAKKRGWLLKELHFALLGIPKEWN